MLNLRKRGGALPDGTVLGLLMAAVAIATAGAVTILVREGGAPSALTPPTRAAAAGRAALPNLGVAAIEPGDSPVRVRIPAIGVNATLVPLGVDTRGALEVPQYDEAGWFTGGSRPGEVGPAVIVAHVDSRSGPAVFSRLDDLEPGHEVQVHYPSVTVRFVVRKTEQVDKSTFPTQRVYGQTEAPELRLVTCAGAFDRKTRSYASNLIVWADLLTPT